jgi:hypothetical protein
VQCCQAVVDLCAQLLLLLKLLLLLQEVVKLLHEVLHGALPAVQLLQLSVTATQATSSRKEATRRSSQTQRM